MSDFLGILFFWAILIGVAVFICLLGDLVRKPSSGKDQFEHAVKQRLSSVATFFFKVIFIAVWAISFGGVAMVFFSPGSTIPLEFPFVWLLGGLFIWMRGAHLKSVALEGDALVISNYLRQIRVPLSDIVEIRQRRWDQTRPVTVWFRNPTSFGRSITFIPAATGFFSWFSEDPIVNKLRSLAAATPLAQEGKRP